jgi:hypothetical protein
VNNDAWIIQHHVRRYRRVLQTQIAEAERRAIGRLLVEAEEVLTEMSGSSSRTPTMCDNRSAPEPSKTERRKEARWLI